MMVHLEASMIFPLAHGYESDIAVKSFQKPFRLIFSFLNFFSLEEV